MTIQTKFSPTKISEEEFLQHLFKNTIFNSDRDEPDKLQRIIKISDPDNNKDHIIFHNGKNSGTVELLAITRCADNSFEFVRFTPVHKETNNNGTDI